MFVHELQEREAILARDAVVVFSEGRSDVDDAGSRTMLLRTIDDDEVRSDDLERLAATGAWSRRSAGATSPGGQVARPTLFSKRSAWAMIWAGSAMIFSWSSAAAGVRSVRSAIPQSRMRGIRTQS